MQNFEMFRGDETLKTEYITSEQILQKEQSKQKRLFDELERFFCSVFPKVKRPDLDEFIDHYFYTAQGDLDTWALLARNKQGQIVATNLFYYGKFSSYNGKTYLGAYAHIGALLPEYRGCGLGQTMAQNILMKFNPDIFMTSCVHAAAVHLWRGILQKGMVEGYEMYPRFDDEKKQVLTVPTPHLAFCVDAFATLFKAGVGEGCDKQTRNAIKNLTVLMTRKNLSLDYGHHPWQRDGKEDTLAGGLGVTSKDAIVITVLKNGLLES